MIGSERRRLPAAQAVARASPGCKVRFCLRVGAAGGTGGSGRENLHVRRKAKPPQDIVLVTTRSRCEGSVVRRARDAGIQAYSPRFLDFSDMSEHVLFPGYVFVWVSTEWRKVLGLVGVVDFVRCGETPSVVKPDIVTKLRSRENKHGFVILDRLFQAGDKVRVEGGTALGICQGYAPHARVRVLFQILGHGVEMCMPERELVAA